MSNSLASWEVGVSATDTLVRSNNDDIKWFSDSAGFERIWISVCVFSEGELFE